MLKKVTVIFIVSFIFSVSAWAKSVAFQIIQRQDKDDPVREAVIVMEDTLFDYFFSKGIIASNSPIINSESAQKDKTLFKKSMDEARDGNVQYFIEIIAEYGLDDSTNPDAALLGNIKCITWNVRILKTEESLGSGKMTPPKLVAFKNEQAGLADFTIDLAERIYKTLK